MNTKKFNSTQLGCLYLGDFTVVINMTLKICCRVFNET